MYVNVYELNREYGGPEEGGWWYDTGTVVESVDVNHLFTGTTDEFFERYRHESTGATPLTDVEREVFNVEARLFAEYPSNGKRGYTSYRGGDYRIIIEDHKAKDWPEVIPHYE